MKAFKVAVASTLAIVLFMTNYQICEYFYSDNLVSWWELRTTIYSVIFALLFLISAASTKGAVRFILMFGAGISISDIIDRIFFNIREFTLSDITMIILVLIVSYKDYDRKNSGFAQ